MKKSAFVFMGPGYDPELHQAEFELGNRLTSVFTVNDFEGAKQRVAWCHRQGYGVVELCGAFGEEKAKQLVELTDGEVGIGYVVNSPGQQQMIMDFFTKP